MAFLPLTLADFRLISAGVFTEAGAGNPVSTPHAVGATFPNGTGTGDQLVTTPDVDAAQCIAVVCDRTAVCMSRLTHTSDTSKRIRTQNVATNAAANGRVSFSIWAPPPGLFQ